MYKTVHDFLVALSFVQNVDLAAHVHSTYGFDLDASDRDVAVIFLIGFLLRVIACIVMAVMDRAKKV